MKIIRFRCREPITRHGKQLPKGAEFEIKSTSSRVHVDRWLREGRLEQVKEVTAKSQPAAEFRHTPGRWKAGENHIEAGRFTYFPRWKGAASNDELAANARLLAAAPQLLKACTEALEHVEANDDDADALNVISALRRAITAAIGRKP